MKFRVLIGTLLLLTACGGNNSPSVPLSKTRNYSGTASVGDFLNLQLDASTQTITYTNLSNGDTGAVPYTANADGTYTLGRSERQS